jgi:hypothetical protein
MIFIGFLNNFLKKQVIFPCIDHITLPFPNKNPGCVLGQHNMNMPLIIFKHVVYK